MRKNLNNYKRIHNFVSSVIERFKVTKPAWMPPHKTIYKTAKEHGFTDIKIDGRSEEKFNENWETLFENGELEDEVIKVTFKDNGKKQTVKLGSNDLKELHLL